MSNRRRGHDYERKVVNKFKEWGFKDIFTSRYASKLLDDKKVDIAGLPFNVQIKNYSKQVKILDTIEEMPKDEINILYIKETKKKGTRFFKRGEYIVVKPSFFGKLIKKYYEL